MAIFTFGDARFYGSTGAVHLDRPIIGMAPTPDGAGYWLFASDGGIFTFGDARFYGSTGGTTLNQPIVAMAPTPDDGGYWLVAADGGVFTFGDAGFYGSTGSAPSPEPIERIVPTHSGLGYWIISQNGTADAFGDATGAPPDRCPHVPARHAGRRRRALRLRPTGQALHLGGQRAGRLRLLRVWPWRPGCTPTTSASPGWPNDQYETAGTPVALSDLVAGDLVFWGSSQTDWTTVYHTAIYVGGGQIVEATGDHVQLNSLGQWGQSDLMPNGRRP